GGRGWPMCGWSVMVSSITWTLADRSRRPPVVLAAAAAVAVLPQFAAGTPTLAAHTGAATAGAGSYVLTATSTGGSYAPTFTGNGYLGVRVPPAGQGYAGGSVPAESTLAGFYAQAPGQVQQRANLPTWSTLTFSDGGQDFSLGTGQVSGWQEQLDPHTGAISTTATGSAPDGQVTAR